MNWRLKIVQNSRIILLNLVVLSNKIALKTKNQLLIHPGIRSILLLLVLSLSTVLSWGQDSIDTAKVKRLVINKGDIKEIITYNATDSCVGLVKENRVYLYGNAYINYDGIEMRAEYLEMDLKKNEVYATHGTDSLGRNFGDPVFIQDGDTLKASGIRYNFDTKKGYIEEVAIHESEYYLTMERATIQANEDVHFVHGKFTTCNLDEPHFHFGLSKAVMVPNKRIVTGAMNLWIMGVPTPIGLPFGIIPIKDREERQRGFIMPQYSVISAYGMGIQDLGYYFPISDRFQTIAYGTLFSRGTFGLKSYSEYAKRYKYNGNFELGYTRYRFGFPDSTIINATTVKWVHTQDSKANPSWSFSANVNFNSNSSNKQTLNVQNTSYFDNTLNSDIRVGKTFGSKPISANMKLNLRQNSNSSSNVLTAPIINFQTTSRIYPFKRVNKVVGFTYAAEIQNQSTYKDRYMKNGNFDSIAQQFRNGITQNFNLQTTLNLFKGTVRITPNVTYKQIVNFQTVSKYVTASDSLITDTVSKPGFSHSLSSSLSVTSTLYSYYRFIGKRNTLLRHVMTPTVSFTYTPLIQQGIQEYTDTSNVVHRYSIFEKSLYSESLQYNSGKINFTVNNTFELKQKSPKDTVTGFKKFKLIDNFTLNTSYDIFKDTMKWSDLTMRLVINPNTLFNFTLTATHSWYGWNDSTGVTVKEFAFQTGQGIGRIKATSIATTLILTSKENREKLQSNVSQMANVWNPQYQNWLVNPYQYVYFDIPWKITLDHVFGLTANSSKSTFHSKRYVPTHTISMQGDINITENWKIATRVMYDIQNKVISNMNISLTRNIHCWNVAFNWVPIGTNKSFIVSLTGNSSLFKSANIKIRKPPIVLN